jgi:hypothetical protein
MDELNPLLITPGIYRHYKGPLYEVMGAARHSETEDVFVVYRPVDQPDSWWIRPWAMFTQQVCSDDVTQARFQYLYPSKLKTRGIGGCRT